MVNRHSGGFDFCKKNLKSFFLVSVRARYKPSLVFRLGRVCSKFTFSAGILLFGLKTISHGKPDLKNSFLRTDLRLGKVQHEIQENVRPDLQCEEVFMAKS